MCEKFLCYPNNVKEVNILQKFITEHFISVSNNQWDIYAIKTLVSGLGLNNDPLVNSADSIKEYILYNVRTIESISSEDVLLCKIKFPTCIFIKMPDIIPGILPNADYKISARLPGPLYIEQAINRPYISPVFNALKCI